MHYSTCSVLYRYCTVIHYCTGTVLYCTCNVLYCRSVLNLFCTVIYYCTGTVLYDRVSYSTVVSITVQYRYGTGSLLQYSTVQYIKVQVQYITLQHRYSTAQIQYSMIQYRPGHRYGTVVYCNYCTVQFRLYPVHPLIYS